jgi:hypothetical protein
MTIIIIITKIQDKIKIRRFDNLGIIINNYIFFCVIEYIMEKIYNQLLFKITNEISKPEFKKKINQHLIDPLIDDIFQKTHNYFITIISLYSVSILLLLIIIVMLIYKKHD